MQIPYFWAKKHNFLFNPTSIFHITCIISSFISLVLEKFHPHPKKIILFLKISSILIIIPPTSAKMHPHTAFRILAKIAIFVDFTGFFWIRFINYI